MRRVIRSSRYERAAARLLRPSVQQELEESIAAEPERHPLSFMVRPDLVFLAEIYAKNEKENLTHAERNQLQKIASEIQREFGG